MTRRRRLVVVANRLPVHRAGRQSRWESSAGGLVTAMAPVLQAQHGSWIGWTGSAGDAPRPFEHNGIMIRPVEFSGGEIERFYHGMSNRTLWPLYHDAIRTPEFRREWWSAYVQANLRFARAAAREARPGDLVWVHDYQLQLVPQLLRKIRPDVRIGFFLHIPFPPEELFEWLPWRREVLEGLLGADLVGFQTFKGAQNFSRLARQYTSAEGTDTELTFEDRTIAVNSYPISIDTAWFEAAADLPETKRKAAEIRRRIGPERRIILAVDRLDYTKGIDVRLEMYEEMLRAGTIDPERVVLIQIAVPSRENVDEYEQLRTKVEQTVGRINGQFSRPGMVAVHYFRRNLTREELVAYYVAADVMLVTPLRDGMNLVAKEYVACRTENTGVLVLSEFAGAARELRRALLVNPRDVSQVQRSTLEALGLRHKDLRMRMAILRTIVRRHDVHEWSGRFLGMLGEV